MPVTIRGKPSKKDMEMVEKLMGNKKLKKSLDNLINTNQKLADKYGATVSIEFEGKETIIAKPSPDEKAK